MVQFQKAFNSDLVGAAASALCFVHCVATPFIFVASVCTSTCCADTPVWWQAIDYIFLVISFIAIYYATAKTSKRWVAIAMWASWSVLLLTILNETFELGVVSHEFIYVPALAIIALHIYNHRFCRCDGDGCCAHQN